MNVYILDFSKIKSICLANLLV